MTKEEIIKRVNLINDRRALELDELYEVLRNLDDEEDIEFIEEDISDLEYSIEKLNHEISYYEKDEYSQEEFLRYIHDDHGITKEDIEELKI